MSRLIWHRRDLRLHDNELYFNASKIYSLFIFDPTDYSSYPTTVPFVEEKENGDAPQNKLPCRLYNVTHGPHFTRHLIHAVCSLRNNLQSMGGDLIVRTGDPLEVIPSLSKQLGVEEVAWCEIPGYYECRKSEKLRKILMNRGTVKSCKVHTTTSLTLAHPDDLPKDQSTWERLARPKEKRKKGKQKCKQLDSLEPHHNADESNTLSSNSMVDVSPSRFVGMPFIMGDFRRAARTNAPIRELYGQVNPQHIARDFKSVDVGTIPSLAELTEPLLESDSPPILGLPKELVHRLVKNARQIMPKELVENLESKAINDLIDFVKNHAAKADRSACDVSNNGSTKWSVPLALGLLSPRQIYHCVRKEQQYLEIQLKQQQQQQQHLLNLEAPIDNHQDGNVDISTETMDATKPEDLNWLIHHLEIRDFFLFECFRSGSSFYNLQPMSQPVSKHKKSAEAVNNPPKWLSLSSDNKATFFQWASGQTNLPMVDAGMNELITTGYTSNRVRQNMASVLTKDLGFDWRLGAEWFQLCLGDHCVAANYGNWAYFAGVGGDPKNRHFRTISQALRYDPEGRYVRRWIQRLQDLKSGDGGVVDVEILLRPWDFLPDYGAPFVPMESQLTWQDKEKLIHSGRISSSESGFPS